MPNKRIISRYVAFQFFFSLLFWVPVFHECQRRAGLSDAEIFGIQSLYYLAFCLFEIPTGLAADRWGYRPCLRAGAALLVLGNLLPVALPDYAGFLAHFLLVALSRSLISGASSAYLYEFLQEQGRAQEYKPIEGRARSLGLIGKVAGWALIGVLMSGHFMLPYVLSGLSAAVAVAYALSLPAIGSSGQRAREAFGLAELRGILGVLRSAPRLPLVMLQGIALFVLVRICQVNLYQPILSAKGFDVASYGLLMSGMTVFEAWGSARPDLFKGRWMADHWNAVFAFTIAMVASLLLMPGAGQAGTVALFCFFSFVAGISFPVQRQLLNDEISAAPGASSRRATLLSVESILDRAFCAWAAWVLGETASGATAWSGFIYLSGGLTLGLMAAVWFANAWLGRKRGWAVSA